MKRHFANMVFALILIAYTVYAALDTFVIVRVLTPDTLPTATAEASTAPTGAPTAVPTATESPAEQTTTAPISTDTEYHDDQIDIVLTTMRVENTTVYVADVQLADISLLKTALAGNTYARNLTETTSVQAANAGAILAINGDYYGAQERGYVLRNGVLYRASAQSGTDALVIGADGNFRIITEGAWQVLTFGPALINGGQVTVSSSDEVGRAMTSNPRTAIGQISEGHYLLVVSDGRTKESAGLSLRQLAELMQSLGAQVAYNLDGGGSSTMVFQGRVVNSPTTNGRSIRERSVSDIVYIGY